MSQLRKRIAIRTTYHRNNWTDNWRDIGRYRDSSSFTLIDRREEKRRRQTNIRYLRRDVSPMIMHMVNQILPITDTKKTVVDPTTFDNIPTITYVLDGNEDEREECSICLEEFADSENLKTPSCGHKFHIICLRQWVEKQDSRCPMCRNPVMDTK